MDTLGSETLSKIIERCSDYSGYQAGIVFVSRAQRNMFLESMKEMNHLGDVLWRVDKRSGVAKFRNGSVIKALVFTEQSRGQRFHEIIFDKQVVMEGVPEDVILSIYSPMLMPYKVDGDFVEERSSDKNERATYKAPEQELDDFLGSFTIT